MLIGVDLCRAVAAVHGARLLHGDIKANNVMRATGGRTVLMDFGAGHDLKAAPALGHAEPPARPSTSRPRCWTASPARRRRISTASASCCSTSRPARYPVDGHDPRRQSSAARDAARRADCSATCAPTCPSRSSTWWNGRRPSGPRIATRRRASSRPRSNRAQRDEDPVPMPTPAPRLAAPAGGGPGGRAAGGGIPGWTSGAATSIVPLAARRAWHWRVPPPAPPRRAPTRWKPRSIATRVARPCACSRARGSRPATSSRCRFRARCRSYVYVVNEDDRGESYLLFPLPDQQLTNPLPARRAARDSRRRERRAHRWVVEHRGRSGALPGLRHARAPDHRRSSDVRRAASPGARRDRSGAAGAGRLVARTARRGRAGRRLPPARRANG